MNVKPHYASAVVSLFFTGCGAGCEPYPGTGSSDSTSSSSGGASSADGGSTTVPAGARRPINGEKICNRLVTECAQPITKSECLTQFTGILVTGTCADALSAATCADLTSSTSSVLLTCFPPCSGTLATCNGDGSITICTAAGTTNVLDCEAACRADGNRAYSGTCGTSFGAQISDRPQCFCQ